MRSTSRTSCATKSYAKEVASVAPRQDRGAGHSRVRMSGPGFCGQPGGSSGADPSPPFSRTHRALQDLLDVEAQHRREPLHRPVGAAHPLVEGVGHALALAADP